MKIVIDGRLYGLEHAGLGRYVLNLVNRLAVIDHKNQYEILLRKKYFNNLKLPSNWKKRLCDIQHYSLTEQIAIPNILKEIKPDLVHFPHFNVPVFYSGPFVVTIHDILMHKKKGLDTTTLPAPVYLVKRLGYHRVFKHAVNESQKIIVPSNYSKQEIVKYYQLDPEKVAVTYEGFDEKIKNLLSAERVVAKYKLTRPFFIYAGNAYPHKNLTRLIEAFAILGGKAQLAIVSSRNVFTEKLSKLIINLKAERHVKLLGFVPDEDLGVLYGASAAFVFPSLSEGFGLPGLEALATGALLLASEIPVFKEVYGEHATYFNPYDFSSIQKSLEDVLKINPKARKAKIDSGKKFAKRYSWDKMARETLKIYADCTGIRSGK
jgi:glycosyltransferase involved in cell wall biosynthesis